MSTIDDAKLANLKALGYSGTIDDAYRAYLVVNAGVSTGSIQDLEKLVLTSLGYTGSVTDMWIALLKSRGYSGTLNDMMKYAWENDSDIFNIVLADYLLLENGSKLLQESGDKIIL
jgi:hypothetical protein